MSRKDPAPTLDVIETTDPPASAVNDSIIVLTAGAAGMAGLAFGLGLLLGASLQFYGGALALALILLAIAVRRYFTGRYPDVTATEPRHPEAPDDDAPLAFVTPTGPRRSFLARFLAGAAGLLGLGLLAPVASLGPTPGDTLRTTRWARGTRLVTSQGEPVRATDVAAGGIASIWPEDAIGHERSSVLLVRLQQAPQPPTNLDWMVEDVVAYSKVCTHAGCPVALYRERDNALFCPCHQSTFDPARGAIPTFGPAARHLPQLPLGTDDEGYLVALGDFEAQVGPALPRG